MGTNRQELLFLFLDKLGVSFKKVDKDFFARKAIQKNTYLLQSLFDIKFGYNFILSLNGPTSPSLMDDAHMIKDQIKRFKNLNKTCSLNDDAKKIIQAYKDKLKFRKNRNEEVDTCATIHFLHNNTFFEENQDEQDRKVREYFGRMKSHLVQYYDECFNLLRQYGWMKRNNKVKRELVKNV